MLPVILEQKGREMRDIKIIINSNQRCKEVLNFQADAKLQLTMGSNILGCNPELLA